ncbi:hypothetical protein [Halomicrobium zhouii]|nr:hypothetical protein [Halomicrobium zhouii]
MRRATALKILCVLTFISTAIGAFLAQNEVISEFIWSTLVYSDHIMETGHLSGDGNNPGYIVILSIFRLILGVSPELVVVLPIGILIGPFIYYAVTRSLFGTKLVALACTFYILTHITETAWHSVFAYAWARPLYLLCLVILISGLASSQNRIDNRYLYLFGIMVAALPWLHYTPEAWLILFAGTVLIIGYLDGQPWTEYLALGFVIMMSAYIGSTRIIYDTFLPSLFAMVEQETHSNPVQIFIVQIMSMIVGETSAVSKYQVAAGSPIYSRVRLAINVLIAGVILLSAPFVIKRIIAGIRASKPSIELPTYVYVGLVSTLFFHALVYGIVFSLSTQPLIFLGPILGLLALDQITKRKKVFVGFLVFLIVLSAVSVILRLGQFDIYYRRYSLIEPGVRWFSVYAQHDPYQDISVMSSSHLFYYFNYIASPENFQSVSINADHYAALVGDNKSVSGSADYMVADMRSKEVVVQGEHLNIQYEPLNTHHAEIQANTELQKVYSDGMSDYYRIEENQTSK